MSNSGGSMLLQKANEILSEIISAKAWHVDDSKLITELDEETVTNGITSLDEIALIFLMNCTEYDSNLISSICEEVSFTGHDLSLARRGVEKGEFFITQGNDDKTQIRVKCYLSDDIPPDAELEIPEKGYLPSSKPRALGSEARSKLVDTYSDMIDSTSSEAILDYKAWGKSTSLWCFFTLATGEKVAINCFRSKRDHKTYGPRDDSVDFSEPGIEGTRYHLDIVKSKSGYLNLKSARPM